VRAGRFNLKRANDDCEKRALPSALRVGGSATAAAKLIGTAGRGDAQDPGDTTLASCRRRGRVPPRGHRHRAAIDDDPSGSFRVLAAAGSSMVSSLTVVKRRWGSVAMVLQTAA